MRGHDLLALLVGTAAGATTSQPVALDPNATADTSCASTLQTYVLNLNRRTDRLARFSSALPEVLRPNVRRIAAVEGRLLPKEMPPRLISASEWSDAVLRDSGHVPSIGSNRVTINAVGLTLSHMLAWHHIVATNATRALIAEDDAVFFTSDFASQLERLCGQEAANFDFVQLQNDNPTWPKIRADTEGLGARSSVPTQLLAHTSYNTGLYAITNEGARRALAAAAPIALQLDAECGTLRGSGVLRAGAFVPPICQTSMVDSDAQVAALPHKISLAEQPVVPDCDGLPSETDARLALLVNASIAAALHVSTQRTDIDRGGKHACA